MRLKLKAVHPLEWLVEPLESHPEFHRRKMFGCEAIYFERKLMLVLAAGKEPWNGALFPAERDQHEAILTDFPDLKSHPILGKWLYLSQRNGAFEEIATKVITRIRRGDLRFGSTPIPKKKKKTRA